MAIRVIQEENSPNEVLIGALSTSKSQGGRWWLRRARLRTELRVFERAKNDGSGVNSATETDNSTAPTSTLQVSRVAQAATDC